MSKTDKVDEAIRDGLVVLKEEKYKLRTFQVDILLRIDSQYGVDETIQDIRSFQGVTVVTALDSRFREISGEYDSAVRIKFHPQKESLPGNTYVDEMLVPHLNSSSIPGVRVIRKLSGVERIK